MIFVNQLLSAVLQVAILTAIPLPLTGAPPDSSDGSACIGPGGFPFHTFWVFSPDFWR